ncbi:sushi, von Willebrand factor type A, EGF and pentraxin domain-containing protein 1-like [Mercenaria mercenaria]|uniref:sushi, von Willebrand factor type A, EGF and pentraxin domain-containing protein 1-like n=1 Tax=Mercenaria mercenaria TaxID=6596 RepID=UPI00234F6791|nr:sushi, von Willebrand factor type A, EGF and pentraxin domain-containing protein 1-like [Mercenaria mercenaria]
MHKPYRLLLCLFICVGFAPSVVFCKLSFNVFRWNTCLPDEFRLKTIVGIALQECIEECGKRQSCVYTGYLRNVNLCKLYNGVDMSSLIEEGPCLVIRRGDIDNSVFPEDCTCDERQVCNDGMCKYEECSQLSFANGYVVGNKNDISSRHTVYCESGYTEVNGHGLVTCGMSGNWSYYPSCISTTVCDDMTIENGDLTGTGNGVGAVRTIVCGTGYEEQLGETSIQCDSTGNWSYIPTCSQIIVCDDMTIANGDLVGSGNGVGAVRIIVCGTGYEEQLGETSIQCDNTGNWSYIPTCSQIIVEDADSSDDSSDSDSS